MSTTTDLSTLKINYLTQAQYDTALTNNQINANELYFTPSSGSFEIGGDARISSAFYANTSSPYTCSLQMKRQNASMLNLSVQDDGWLKLQNVPYVSGEDDWTNASTLWDVNMTKVPMIDWKYKSGSHTQSAANAWEQSFSFTVPSGHGYLAYVYAGWSSGTPTGLGIHSSSTLSQTNPKYAITGDGIQQSPIWFLASGTYYVFIKRNSSGNTNTNYVYVLDITPVPSSWTVIT